MEEESAKLKQMHSEMDRQISITSTHGSNPALNLSVEEKIEIDARYKDEENFVSYGT